KVLCLVPSSSSFRSFPLDKSSVATVSTSIATLAVTHTSHRHTHRDLSYTRTHTVGRHTHHTHTCTHTLAPTHTLTHTLTYTHTHTHVCTHTHTYMHSSYSLMYTPYF